MDQQYKDDICQIYAISHTIQHSSAKIKAVLKSKLKYFMEYITHHYVEDAGFIKPVSYNAVAVQNLLCKIYIIISYHGYSWGREGNKTVSIGRYTQYFYVNVHAISMHFFVYNLQCNILYGTGLKYYM